MGQRPRRCWAAKIFNSFVSPCGLAHGGSLQDLETGDTKPYNKFSKIATTYNFLVMTCKAIGDLEKCYHVLILLLVVPVHLKRCQPTNDNAKVWYTNKVIIVNNYKKSFRTYREYG